MNNACLDTIHSKDFYKGKSLDFAGVWLPGMRYFNDEFTTNFVVYSEDQSKGSALLGCKKNHISSEDPLDKFGNIKSNSTNNQPHLIYKDNSIIGIEPNDYWIFICGSIQGKDGKSSLWVTTYSKALLLATEDNKGALIYVDDSKEEYIVIGEGQLERVVIGNEVEKLWESKVDKIDGKGLSTEDYTTEEKVKLATVSLNAQENVIEEIKVNGSPLQVVGKSVNINIARDNYVIEKLNTPVGNFYASYALKMNGNVAGSIINIPKDTTIDTGAIKTVTSNGNPYSGAVVGDKYIDIILNDISRTHIYIPANALMDIYTGDKYINVNYQAKEISLKYNDLKAQLDKDINIKVDQVETLGKRLQFLESDESKVTSLSDSTYSIVGKVKLDPKYFEIEPGSNRITIKAVQFESAGVAEEVRAQLTGSKDDKLEDVTSLNSLKNAILDLASKQGITKDEIGNGLIYNEEDQKLELNLKDGSSLHINEKGELELIWKD